MNTQNFVKFTKTPKFTKSSVHRSERDKSHNRKAKRADKRNFEY